MAATAIAPVDVTAAAVQPGVTSAPPWPLWQRGVASCLTPCQRRRSPDRACRSCVRREMVRSGWRWSMDLGSTKSLVAANHGCRPRAPQSEVVGLYALLCQLIGQVWSISRVDGGYNVEVASACLVRHRSTHGDWLRWW